MKRLPGFTYIDLGPDGGPFDQNYDPKVVLHTTEGSTLAGAEAAFRAYPPHLGYDPVRRIKHQYVSLDRHSYALRNSEAEDDYAIQVEIVGFANKTHTWAPTVLRNLAEDLFIPLEKAIGVPRFNKRFYRADEGIVLATANSPIRLTNAQWRAFSGWLGHQHAPAPDIHWDPGGFPIAKVFAFMESEDDVNLNDKLPPAKMSDGKEYILTVGDALHGMVQYIAGQGGAGDLTAHPQGQYVGRVLSLAKIREDLDALTSKVDAILSKLNESGGPINGA